MWDTITSSNVVQPNSAEEIAIFTTDKSQVPYQLKHLGKLHVFGRFDGDAVMINKYDTTFDGKPLFGSLLWETERLAKRYKYVVWTNSDIHIPRLPEVLRQLEPLDYPWFAVATRYDVGHNSIDMHTKGGVDVFIWNRPDIATVRYPYPPFIRNCNQWDNWWVTEAATFRTVINITKLLYATHHNHNGTDWAHWKASWYNFHNRCVANEYQRGYTYGLGVQAPLELSGKGIKVTHQPLKPFKYHPQQMKYFSLFHVNKKSHQGHQMNNLLQNQSNIVLTGGNNGFFDIIMTFVCNCRRLGMTNLVVAAFDKRVFERLYMQGVAVFLIPFELRSTIASTAETYGTKSYKTLTKCKTRIIQTVLSSMAKIQIAWIDPDVILYKKIDFNLFKNDFYIQNNNPTHLPASEPKLNSGVYIIRNSVWVRSVFTAIDEFSKTSVASEQHSFNTILCSSYLSTEGPCFWNDHQIVLLPRTEFATGHASDTETNAVLHNTFMGTLWHNNWVIYDNKLTRLPKNLFFWDKKVQVCNYKT